MCLSGAQERRVIPTAQARGLHTGDWINVSSLQTTDQCVPAVSRILSTRLIGLLAGVPQRGGATTWTPTWTQ
jgi:hypothetical protein